MNTKKFKTIDEYLEASPKEVKDKLSQFRSTIKKAAPKAEETISYQMPAFKLHGNLVYFAAFKKHIGFYPMPGAIKAFRKELADYKTSKGAVQFPIDKPLPLLLITKIVKYRIKENLKKKTLK